MLWPTIMTRGLYRYATPERATRSGDELLPILGVGNDTFWGFSDRESGPFQE